MQTFWQTINCFGKLLQAKTFLELRDYKAYPQKHSWESKLARQEGSRRISLPAAFASIFCSISSMEEMGQDFRKSKRLWRMKSFMSFSIFSVLSDNEIVGTFLNAPLMLADSRLENRILHLILGPVNRRIMCVNISF